MLIDMHLNRGQTVAMSVIEDVPQALQDFLAPELRALTARIDSLEVKMDSRLEAMTAGISSLEVRINSKFEVADSKIASLNSRMDHAEQSANARHATLLDQFEFVKRLLDVDYRLKKLERQQSEPAA